MRTIYVIAHPEATHHVEDVVGGWHDSDLTPDGFKAADAIGAALRDAIPDGADVEVFSSDLRRASRTADAVGARFSATPMLDHRLREKCYGAAEGKPQEFLTEQFVPPPVVGDRMSHHEGIDGAETRIAFAERIYAAVEMILARPCEHQVVSTHGFALTFVVAAWIKMPIESTGYINLLAPPGSITTLREDDRFHNRQVVSLGSTSHLPG